MESISDIMDAYDESRITKTQAKHLLAKREEQGHGGRINDLTLLLDLWGIGYKLARIRENKYVSIIARDGVYGDAHCFAQFEFDKNGYFVSCGIFKHEIGKAEN